MTARENSELLSLLPNTLLKPMLDHTTCMTDMISDAKMSVEPF